MLNKLAFYINVVDSGGAERVITNIANQFSKAGYEVIFITSYACAREYPLSKQIKRYNLLSHPQKLGRVRRNMKCISSLRKICKREKPDALISFMAEPNMRAVLATFGLNTKVIVSVRNDPNREYAGRILRLIGKRLLPMADGCVFQTEEAKNWFPQKLQRKSIVIANAVKTEFYEKQRHPQCHLLVACGRLEEQKNYGLLLDSFAEVVRTIPDVRLKIYGMGSLRDFVVNKIDEYQLNDYVELKGQTDDVPSALAEADLFVMCSDYEGMPNALMEALTMGIPSVATDCPCGGPKFLIDNQVNGVLVPTNEKKSLVNAINSLLNDDLKKNRLGYAAKLAAKKYHPDVIYGEWLNYIEDIVSSKGKKNDTM